MALTRVLLTLALVSGLATNLAEAQANPAALAARQWREKNEIPILEEFVELLRVPNVSRDRANVLRNAELIVRMMEKRGISARLITAEGANPLVVGEIRTPGARRTIGFYAHYDGAPLDEREWTTPPFTPTLRTATTEAGGQVIPVPARGTRIDPEWRLYARSAGDDKAPIIAMLAALDAMKAAGIALKSNIRFAFDGEEEANSPNLAKMMSVNRSLLTADVWLICDGPIHQTRRQLMYFGARDVTRLDITVYGPRVELHSGHYGNWAINPAMSLARLLASMKDDNGRVLVDGFYDDVEPLSATERRAIAEAPDIDQDLKQALWLGSTEGGSAKLLDLITIPSLNIRGMASSRVGAQASNVIPATATASIDIRLVKGMDPRKTQNQVIAHIRRQGFHVVDQPPDSVTRLAHAKIAMVQRGPAGLGAVRTPMDLPISREVIGIVESARGPTIKLPNMGGSLPLAEIETSLGTRTIVIPIANHDNNQHSFNENLRIRNLWDGIELLAALIAM